MSALGTVMRPQADIGQCVADGSVLTSTRLVQPAPGLAAAEHAAEGAALNPQAVRTLQRDRRIIGAAGVRIVNSPAPFGSLPGFMLIRTCSPFWFDFASTEYPQRLVPHCSIRTLPSFSSVSHTPSGEFADWAAVIAGACWLGAGPTAEPSRRQAPVPASWWPGQHPAEPAAQARWQGDCV